MEAKREAQAGARLLGVLGGMGPAATVDFLRKLIELTPAARDEEHVPLVVYSVPQMPDRTAAILAEGPSPLPAMLRGIRVLAQAGAQCVAIPCNTAHHWYRELVARGGLPILHIADAACERLAGLGLRGGAVGLIATSGTLAAGFYQERLAARGYRALVPTEADQERFVMRGIAQVKAGELAAARASLAPAARELVAAGARALVFACTEVPIALERDAGLGAPVVDATEALAAACVRWALEAPARAPAPARAS
jgi:aspartate racemase